MHFSAIRSQIFEIDNDTISLIAREVKKPLIIDFYADWCPPCKALTPIFESIAQELEASYAFGRANFDNCKELAGQLGVNSLPTIVILKNGLVLGKIVGSLDKRSLKEKIEEIINGPQDFSQLSKDEVQKRLWQGLLHNDLDMVKRAIAAEADVNAYLKEGNVTPLLFALTSGPQVFGEKTKELAMMLISAGASLYVETPEHGRVHMKTILSQVIGNFERLLTHYDGLIAFLDTLDN